MTPVNASNKSGGPAIVKITHLLLNLWLRKKINWFHLCAKIINEMLCAKISISGVSIKMNQLQSARHMDPEFVASHKELIAVTQITLNNCNCDLVSDADLLPYIEICICSLDNVFFDSESCAAL